MFLCRDGVSRSFRGKRNPDSLGRGRQVGGVKATFVDFKNVWDIRPEAETSSHMFSFLQTAYSFHRKGKINSKTFVTFVSLFTMLFFVKETSQPLFLKF